MNQLYKKKSLSRKRRDRILISLLSITLIILLSGMGLFIWVLNQPAPASESEKTVVQIKNLIINIIEKDRDIRTVKNTATEEQHKTNGLSICMYHYVYDENDPPDKLNNNYIEVTALEEQLQYLVENDYFFPTWEEVRKYIDGELLLPEKSVVLTFDDGSKSFLELGIPLFEKYQVPVTSFIITSNNGEDKVKEYASDYVSFQSHSHDMHRSGGNIGHGGIFTVMPHEEAVADLNESIRICENGEAFAYPYGDYTDAAALAVEEAGFLCGVTTRNARTYPGDNPLLLSRVRMSRGLSLEAFISLVE